MRFVRGKRGMAAAGEDSIIQKLQSAAADGMPAGDGLSAERVQTVMRFAQGVIKDYERAHGTDNFLSDDFKACDMKCVEFEMVRFSSEVLGVVTGSPIDGAEEAEEDLNDLVARKNFLRMQDWDYNGSVLDEKLRPIDQQLLKLDPDTTMDQETIRFLNDQRVAFVVISLTFNPLVVVCNAVISVVCPLVNVSNGVSMGSKSRTTS